MCAPECRKNLSPQNEKSEREKRVESKMIVVLVSWQLYMLKCSVVARP